MHLLASLASLLTLAASADVVQAQTKSWFKPKAGTTFLWSLESQIPVSPKSSSGLPLNFEVYDVDLFDTTAQQIKTYHDQGKKVFCYFSAGSLEPWRSDVKAFNSTCYCNKGSRCKMDGWDEWWLDLHSTSCITNVKSVMRKRLDLAKSKGCDGVEPDNVDSYTNNAGFGTTLQDQYNYLYFLGVSAHNRNLSIALKNSPDMIDRKPAVVNLFDAVVIEECAKYNECASYAPFAKANKAVWQVEYEVSKVTCPIPGFFAMAYSSYSVNYKNVRDYCPK
ncbi:hypothetical protein OIO90_004963 [Microbotryomycetes sp. JL221]|nr:hypothetical protein OIO90_004963 [Microbotryomycetes sp. JL221]